MTGQTTEIINHSITISDSLMIMAVLLAPIVAVQVEKYIEKFKESRRAKLFVFKTLMATRGRALDPNHVQALNMIDLEFVGKKYQLVTSAWAALLDHFDSVPEVPQFGVVDYDALKVKYDSKLELWLDKIPDHQATLLFEMSKALGFDFDKTHIKKSIYSPKAHGDLETEQMLLRKGLIQVLTGNIALPMEIRNWPKNTE